MIWIIASLAALAVLGGLGGLLTGRLGTGAMPEAGTTTPDLDLPLEPTGDDITHLHLDTALRGYRISQVDEVLDRLRDRIVQQDLEIERLRSEHVESSPR